MKLFVLAAAVMLAGCSMLPNGLMLRGQGHIEARIDPDGILDFSATTARALPGVTVKRYADGSVEYLIIPSNKIEELKLLSEILTLP